FFAVRRPGAPTSRPACSASAGASPTPNATCCATSASTPTATSCKWTSSGTGWRWRSTTGLRRACSTGRTRRTSLSISRPRAPPRAGAARRPAGRAEVGGARQARPGQHHGARPLPRARRSGDVAEALLLAAPLKSEPLEHRLVAAPLRGRLHLELQVNGVPDERLDERTRAAPDVAHDAAALADQDLLLALGLRVETNVDELLVDLDHLR